MEQLPSVPASALNKRKWGAPPPGAPSATVEEVVDEDVSAAASKRTRVTEVDDEEEEGPMPPDVDEDDEDEEGGRFFGGGLNDEQKQILEIMNRSTSDGAEESRDEVADTRKMLLQLERAISKNQEMRLKHADDPSRFIESEADLDAALRELVLLTTTVPALYPEFIKHGTAASVVGLLAHENVDIAAAAITVLEELTDDDVLDTTSDEKSAAVMQQLVDTLCASQVLELLVSNLSRLHDVLPADETDVKALAHYASDMEAVYHTLSVLENLVSLRPALAASLGPTTSLVPWLLRRILQPGRFDQNKAYAGELLSILLQDTMSNRETLGEKDGVDVLLQVMARYRAADPSDAEEVEFVENIMDAMCLALLAPGNRQRFLDAEGVELMIRLLKAKRHARAGALKVLDHALSGAEGGLLCERFVDTLGLKALCPLLMRPLQGKGALRPADRERILAIFAALFHNLDSDSAERIRVLAKFVEQNYTKTDQLLEWRAIAVARLQAREASVAEERAVLTAQGVEEADIVALVYGQRLEAGLYTLQLIDYLLAWLAMEDDGVQAHVARMLTRQGTGWEAIVVTLDEYAANIDTDLHAAGGDRLQDIIHALRDYVQALSPRCAPT